MATSLTTKLTLKLGHTYTNALDLTTPEDVLAGLSLSDSLTNGTAADQANAVWHDERTLAATSETLDLQTLTDALGLALTFAAIKAIVIKNSATTTAFDLAVGNAAANPWSACFSDPSDEIIVPPNGIWLWWSPTDAETVDATHSDFKIDSGANAVTYKIWIIGTK